MYLGKRNSKFMWSLLTANESFFSQSFLHKYQFGIQILYEEKAEYH